MKIMDAASASSVSSANEEALQQLGRILSSRSFQQADRLQRFVEFIVKETLNGRGDHLKEFLIGTEVFDKDSTFDPRTDPIVRVQARRLRARLTRYYREEGQNDEILIELPKGGYVPTFKHHALKGAPPKRTVTAALIGRNTVMVLPFSDDSPEGDLDYFCRGLSHEIIHGLTRVNTLRVVTSERTRRADSDRVHQEAVEHPTAAVIVTGSVRKFHDALRITIHLTDAISGCYLWSESLDRSGDDLLAVQEEVTKAVVARLRSEQNTGALAKASKRRTENLAAYNLYLQGRYHLSQRTEEGLRKALDFFEKAIVEDAQYAQAYSGLADSYGLLAHYGVLTPAEVWTKAASNAALAVMLDDNLAEGHTSLAHVKSTQDWDWIGAEREFQRAVSLDPRYPAAHHWYAMSCLAPTERLNEALEEMQTAQSLDPISSIIGRDLAVIHYFKQDYDAALEQCDHTIELNPHFPAAYWILGLVQEQRGEFDESAAAFQRAIQLSPQSPRMHAALCRTLAMSKKRREALKILRKLQELAQERYVSPFELASIYFTLGQTEEGFQWLERAIADRCFELIWLKVDPRFDVVRRDPKFTPLFQQLGLE